MTDGPPAPSTPGTGDTVRRILRDVARTVAHADLALAYCGCVTVATVVVMLQSEERTAEILAEVSANLENLRAAPLVSMLGSAFVVESVWGLALVAQLLVVLAYLQRFVGRLASVVVGLAGHVGAGLVVAAGLATGIFRGFVDESVAAGHRRRRQLRHGRRDGVPRARRPAPVAVVVPGRDGGLLAAAGRDHPDVHRRRARERAGHRAAARPRRRPHGRCGPPCTSARRRLTSGRGDPTGQTSPGSAVRITMRVHAPRYRRSPSSISRR